MAETYFEHMCAETPTRVWVNNPTLEEATMRWPIAPRPVRDLAESGVQQRAELPLGGGSGAGVGVVR